MAKPFNLTAQLNIQGPNNLKPVIGKIKSAISSIKTDIKLNIDTSSAKNISAITRQLNALAKASDKANSSVSSLSGTLANLASGFNNAAGSVASSVGALNQVQKSVKSSGTAIVQTTSAIEDFGKASGLAVRRFAAFSTVTGVIYGLTNAITAGYKEFLVFNKEVVRLSQVTGQSVKDLKGVTDEITRLATNFGVASSDLLAVSSTLAQAGLSASDTRIALEALAKSALAPSFDNITDTTEGAIAAMRQFGIQAGELEGALGSINSVAAAFAVESSDIITAIQRTGGVFAASSKGVSEGTDALNEFIAVFTSIRATTRESAETIATGLRTIFTRIQRGKTIEALKEYGVVLTDLQGKFVGPYEATRRLSEGLSKLDPRDLRFGQIVEELGGFRQIGKVIPLIQQFATAEQALGVAQKGQTSLAKDASIAQQALAVQFTKTRESFLALIRDIGDSTSFKVFTTLALTLANAFISLAGALKPLLPLLLTVASLKVGSALTQFGTGFLSGIGGGKRKGFARGGLVPGSGNGDTVPAMLTPGEFVIRKSAVEAIGSGNLHQMNKYAGGGLVNSNRNAYGDEILSRSEIVKRFRKQGVEISATSELYKDLGRRDSVGSDLRMKKTLELQKSTPRPRTTIQLATLQGESYERNIKTRAGSAKVVARPLQNPAAIEEIQKIVTSASERAIEEIAKVLSKAAGINNISGIDKSILANLANANIAEVTGHLFEAGLKAAGAIAAPNLGGKKAAIDLQNLGPVAPAFGLQPDLATEVTREKKDLGKKSRFRGQIKRFLTERQRFALGGWVRGAYSPQDIASRAQILGLSSEALTSKLEERVGTGPNPNDYKIMPWDIEKLFGLKPSVRPLSAVETQIDEANAKREMRIQRSLEAQGLSMQDYSRSRYRGFEPRRGFASGGSAQDTVPALLTPGEFVINKQSAQKIGYSNLHKMNQIKGFNKGGTVGGVQKFAAGGKALENISTVQITTAITSVLLPQISTLADSFGKINNSYLKGFGEALQSSASSALSTTTAFKLLSKGFSQTNKAKFLTGGIAAGSAIGAGLTGFSNQSTTNLLEKNSKAFSELNKALEDSKNAIDEESKAKAAKELERTFRNLSKTVQENTDALSRNELVGAVGDSASRLSSNITTISTAFLALRPVLRSVARQGLRTGAGFAARAIGAGATIATGGTAALVIGAGLALYEAYNIGTAAIKYFTESSKIAGEETAKFGQALLQVTQQQLKNRLNEPTTIETVGRIRDIRANTDFSEEQKQIAVAGGIGTNILLQQRLRADLGLAANKDIQQYLNEIKGNTQAVNDYNAKLEAAQRGLSKSAAERFIAANPQSNEALKGLTNLTEDELRNIGLKQMGKEILDMSRSAETALYHIKPLRVEMLKLAEVSAMLSASVTRLTANAERSSTELQNSVDITLGKAKFTPNTNLQKTLDVLSNPKGNTTEAFKAALQDALGSLRVSSKGVTPGVESVINNLEGQLTALQFIEKNAASTLSAFNDIPGLAARSDQDLQKVFEDMIPSGGSITDEVRKNIAADMAKRVQSFEGQGTAATVDEIFGTAREDIITSNRENLKVLTDVQKARIDAEKRFIDQMNQNLELMNQSTQNLQKQQGLQAEVNLRMQKMFGAGEPSLNQLNAPFNTRLKVLTGGITDPAEIGRQRQAAQENFTRLMSTRIDPNRFTGGEFTARQKALDDARNNEANKINNFTNALEMVTNNTESLSNAFDKLSQKQEELFKTGENALDIFTSALDPVEFQRKVEAPFNALNRLRAGVGTRSQQLRDIATVRGGMGTLAVTEQQTQSINNLIFKRLSKISGRNLTQFSQAGMQSNPEIQKLQADVQTEADKINTAAEILRKATISAGELIVTGAEDIRANFNKGLASSLLGIVDDINNIRIKVFGQATETRLPVAENGNITAQRQRLMDQILEQARSLGVSIQPEDSADKMTRDIMRRNPTSYERVFGGALSGDLFSSVGTIMSQNNQQILELIRQLEQLKTEGKIPLKPREPPKLETPIPGRTYQRGMQPLELSELKKSISDLTLSVADLKSTIDSKQSIVDGVAVANFNTAVNKLNETTIKVAHNFDVNQDIRMDVAGDVTLSPETIAAISSDIRNQTNNAIAINIRNLETFGSRRQV